MKKPAEVPAAAKPPKDEEYQPGHKEQSLEDILRQNKADDEAERQALEEAKAEKEAAEKEAAAAQQDFEKTKKDLEAMQSIRPSDDELKESCKINNCSVMGGN